ncbi:hypothetical protein GCM10022393_08770 [Aquimarina addita]|uniref:DUF3887 domain-containing protein n=1 Tax=Aquimarina addita TaxID=870485 RepID=A0ABP7XC61_9FLAO
MKKITYLLLLFVCCSFLQTEDSYQSAITEIADAYNQKDADKIFNLFSSELQSSFTIDKVKDFVKDNQESNGLMGEFSFLMDDETGKRYLLEFENSTMILVLELSTDNKIIRLSLEEY